MCNFAYSSDHLFSLYDMLAFHAHRFFNIASTLNLAEAALTDENGHHVTPTQEYCEIIAGHLTAVRGQCIETDLTFSVMQIDRTLDILRAQDMNMIVAANLAGAITSISVRIQDELQSLLFMRIQKEKAKYYLEPWETFGQVVVEKFPSLSRDIEEAGKCLATERNPSCVYHLMRIMEAGLKYLGNSLALQATTNRSWDAVLKKANAELEKPLKDRSSEWQTNETFFSDATARLHAVKNAWRNPSMHVGTDYSDDVALDIYNAVKGFMRHLATKLSE